LARVAHGKVDIAIVGGNSHDWDLAAADLLVHEAGGALTDIDGERLIFNRPQPVHELLVAASGSRHGTALALVRERRAQFA
jgi:myo-inositol-1(or 4)-monophosphatase